MISRKDCTAFVWGSDNYGQLGLPGTNKIHHTPRQIGILHNIRTLACGEKHIAFVNAEGEVFTQGCNADGKLGIDSKTTKASNIPVKVAGLPSNIPAVKVYCGLSHTIVILQNGDAYAWGFGEYGALGSGDFKTKWKPTKIAMNTRVKTASAGAMHSAFVTTEGELYMCGSNDYGELGNPRKEKVAVPIHVVGFRNKVIDVSCGIFYTLVLDELGQVYAMGNNKYGQLGTGNKNPETAPTLVRGFEGEEVVKIAAGYHSGALTSKGELYLWGSGTFGEYLRPTHVKKNLTFIDLSIGGFFGTAVDFKHNVYTWGNNNSGQLGLGNLENVKELTQVTFLRGRNIERVYCGVNFAIALPQRSDYEQSYSQVKSQGTSRIAQSNFHNSSIVSSGGAERGGGEVYNRSVSRNNNNLERGVQELKRTLRELEDSERNLVREKRDLEGKLDILSKDYEKLCAKYQMIEVIVAEKEKIIAIYETKIKELSRTGGEEVLIQNKILAQENARLTELLERNSVLYADKLRTKDEAIVRLERIEQELLRSVKMDPNLHTLIDKKDAEILQLNTQILELRRRLRSNTYEGTTSMMASQFTNPSSLSRDDEEYFLTKIARLEQTIKDRDIQISLLRKAGPTPGQSTNLSSPPTLAQSKFESSTQNELRTRLKLKEKESMELESLLNELNQQLKLKDIQMAQLRARNVGTSTAAPPPAISSVSTAAMAAAEASAAAEAALMRENKLLREEIDLLKDRIEVLQADAKMNVDKYETMLTHGSKPLEIAHNQIRELRNMTDELQLQLNRQGTTAKAKETMSGTLAQELEKEIELTSHLKNQIDQLSFQLKKAHRQLEHQRIAFDEKEKSYQQDIGFLREQKNIGQKHLQNRETDLKDRQFANKNIQDDLHRASSEVAYYRELNAKSQQNYKNVNQQAIELRKKLAVSESLVSSLNDTIELQKMEMDRYKKLKKEIEAKNSEATEKHLQLSQANATIELLNEQLTFKTKQVSQLDNKLKIHLEQSEHKEIDFENELRRMKDAKKKVENDYKDLQSDYKGMQERLQNTILQSQREKDFWQGVQKKSEQYLAMLQQERKEKDELVDEISLTKKDVLKHRKERDEARRDAEDKAGQIEHNTEQIADLTKTIRELEENIKRLGREIDNLHEENRTMKDVTERAQQETEDFKNVAMELRAANAEFAKTEAEYMRTIEELQRQVVDARNESEDYNPRYQALIQRNKELDERNAELADMLNKAIQRQANEYKDKVLGDVAKNATSIFEHLKESVVLSNAKKRRPLQEPPRQIMEESRNLSMKSPPKDVKKEDPYKKIVSAKISDHKRRISESAHKLVELLDIDKDGRHTDSLGDYQKINDKIESIEMQKSNLLNKINSYAEKLRIL